LRLLLRCFGMNLKSWDIAAGALIIKEAGGIVTDFDGEDKYLSSGEIVAGTPKIHHALLRRLIAG